MAHFAKLDENNVVLSIEVVMDSDCLDESNNESEAVGIAFLTETIITSPTLANLLFDPPKTFIHWTLLAPELSATSKLVSLCIIFFLVIYDFPGFKLRYWLCFLNIDLISNC